MLYNCIYLYISKMSTFSRTHQIDWDLQLVAHIIFRKVEETSLCNDF